MERMKPLGREIMCTIARMEMPMRNQSSKKPEPKKPVRGENAQRIEAIMKLAERRQA
jgi:hypothetical protein